MEGFRRRGVLKMCELYRRGILTQQETCKSILFLHLEASLVSEYLDLLPADLRSALVSYLPNLPVSDEEWVAYDGDGLVILDGDEYLWAEMIAEARSATDAARVYLFGSAPTAVGGDFLYRVRSAYRSRLAESTRRREV